MARSKIRGIAEPFAAMGELAPYARRMLKVDEAERAGDAGTALALMRSIPRGPDGKPFWRSWRVERLLQLEMFGPVLPAWATSRWLVEQALQWPHGGARAAAVALRACEEVRGRRVGTAPGSRVRLIDHDWVWRQVFLYDAGRLRHFLTRYADPGLLARADRISQWCRAPMGGFELIERRSDRVIWSDLATGAEIETDNIGSAALVLAGECVIGRLVPVAEGRMFDTVPMEVPEAVAREVAQRPTGWVQVLREARASGEELMTHVSFGFLSDLASPVAVLALLGARESAGAGRTSVELAEELLGAIRGQLTEPDEDPDDIDRWPGRAALVLEPGVFGALVALAGPGDAALIARLGERLAEPAASACRALVVHLGAARPE